MNRLIRMLGLHRKAVWEARRGNAGPAIALGIWNKTTKRIGGR